MLAVAALLAAVALAAAGFAVVTWRLWVAYFGAVRHRCRYQRSPVRVPHRPGTLVTEDGVRLPYRWIPGQLPFVLVVAGGYRRCIEEGFALAADLAAAGPSVLTFEFRGVADGTHRLLAGGTREPADLRAAVAEARRLAGDVPLGIVGLCLGASMAVAVAADDPEVAALWIDGPFVSPLSVLAWAVGTRTRLPGRPVAAAVGLMARLARGVWLWDVRLDRDAARVGDRPVRTVVTDEDLAMPGQRRLRHGLGAGSRERVLYIPGARHAGAYFADPAPYVAEVVRFFEAELALPAVAAG
jgi:hypothetical protein